MGCSARIVIIIVGVIIAIIVIIVGVVSGCRWQERACCANSIVRRTGARARARGQQSLPRPPLLLRCSRPASAGAGVTRRARNWQKRARRENHSRCYLAPNARKKKNSRLA